MQEETTTIELKKEIEDKIAKQSFNSINLKEPTLLQVEQFQDRLRETNNATTAARLLIHLVSGISEAALKTMAISDFKKCDKWLNHFFTERVD